MAASQLGRLLRIGLLLQCGARFTGPELARLMRVSKRTIYRDVRMLQDAGLDVHFDPAERAYALHTRLLKPMQQDSHTRRAAEAPPT